MVEGYHGTNAPTVVNCAPPYRPIPVARPLMFASLHAIIYRQFSISITHTHHAKLGRHLIARNQRSKFRQRKRPEPERRECEPERREREREPKLARRFQTLPLFDIDPLNTVRLPGFWRRSPQRWFTHVETLFHSHRVRSDLSHINHVLTSLDEDGICADENLLGVDVKYSAVKSRLIAAYDVPQATRFRSIIQHGGMGDRRPSQMLRNIRSALPSGIDESKIKEIWLQKLPPTILTVISGLGGSLESLAERADRVANASTGHDLAALAREPDRMQSMETAITALTAPRKTDPLATRTDRDQNRVTAATPVHTSQKTDRKGGSKPAPAAHNTYRLFVNDVRSGRRFLVESGAEISVIPPDSGPRVRSDIVLSAANGTRISTYGPRQLYLNLGFAREFVWTLETADDTEFPVNRFSLDTLEGGFHKHRIEFQSTSSKVRLGPHRHLSQLNSPT
ncbi:Uncharacterized protein FWK35_00022587 [Aphis craccivora]|uniref:DUF7041 domain-containing protein n=1 Tax=Aphis craccivora TaxID=307492 RepID=A0A6G0WYE4_APHCR|nr:Uncharacterized protein FWK35_00022587 [Aphis craccivora]